MSGRLLRLVCTAAVAAHAALVPAPAAAAPEPGPDRDRGVAALLTDLQRLYREAERATESYNATEEKLRAQRAEVERLDRALSRVRLSLHDSRRAAGRLARQQYQSTGISPYLRLLLAGDPQHAVDQGHVIGRLARERAETVGRLTGTERKADELARKARAALDTRLTLAERHRRQRDDVRRRLDAVEALLASLTPGRLAALAEFEERSVEKAQRELVASGALGDGLGEGSGDGLGDGSSDGPADDAKPSGRGDRALDYALRQLGKPYEWGAEGPRTYDCSGLTSEAWAAAGVPVPRTSQEQWARLPRVPLTELRPGDLVIYHPDATHVALYAGDGQVVHAPRPGERIKLSPIANNPILGAVRPEAGR
ncbi:C40 family peptidase [Streptomyces sp. JB150]|uniref:C40 family peptidase n=1 Tax=Streptomyces sp. JB150 TaxID=2714844 RepID=UPI00140CB3A4|nr:C40 family peptidase [Streptomyces sp. JB150]QIJ64716.1 C40 family peptidase [Streptomyces sp. JB150]